MYNNKKYIVLLLLLTLLLNGCQKKVQTVEEPSYKQILQTDEEKYTMSTIEKGTFAMTFQSKNVQMIYGSDAYITSDKKTSKLKELLATEKTAVKKGDVLAVLDLEVSLVDLEEKQLSFERSKAKYLEDQEAKNQAISEMETKFARMPEGIEKRIFELQIEKAILQYEQFLLQTEKNLKQQEETIAEMEQKSTDNTIVAPYDGFIIDVPRLEPGDDVNTGDWICHIVSTEHMLLGVNESGLLRYNMEVEVTTKYIAEETTFTGRVVAAKDVMPEDKWEEMTYIALDDPAKYAEINNASVTTENISLGNVLLVDVNGITTDDDKSYVSVYDDGQISKRYVVIGKSSKKQVWVLQGLTEGQTIITKE